jgi:hypothetical protein
MIAKKRKMKIPKMVISHSEFSVYEKRQILISSKKPSPKGRNVAPPKKKK